LVVAAVVAVALISSPAAAVPPASPTSQTDAVEATGATPGPHFQQNNTTVRHENPDEAGSEDRLEELQGALAARLADRLRGSTLQLSRDQYDRARSVFGDDYDESLERFVDVAGERGDDAAADSVRETTRTQRSYVETVSEYDRTYDRYQAAKERGDEDEARRLARRLDRLATDAQGNATSLDRLYETLSNRTGENFTATRTQVDAIQANVTDRQAEIRAAEFTQTDIELVRTDDEGSFLDPVEVVGVLREQDGPPLADRRVRLTLGPREYAVRTSETGRFRLSYRPTTAPVSTESLTVRYRPAETSVYLGSNATFDVSIDATRADVTLQSAPERVGFGQRAALRGQVTAGGTPVAGVPLTVALGDAGLATVTTDEDGRFVVDARLGATPTPGTHQIHVDSQRAGAAVTVEAAVGEVRVVEREPTLTARATETDAGVRVSGRLRGPNGTAVGGQSVRLVVGGTVVQTVQTDSEGRYATALDEHTVSARNVSRVTVRFTGTGTNLAAAEATASSVGSTADPSQSSLLTPVTGAAALASLLVTVAAVVTLRRRRDDPPGPDAPSIDSSEPDVTDTPSRPTLDPARAALEDGDPNGAVTAAYATTRSLVARSFDVDERATPGQFVRAARRVELSRLEDLRHLTDAYERARYSRGGVSLEEAESALDAAEQVVTTIRPPVSEPEAGDDA
jgi:hypothetical protein